MKILSLAIAGALLLAACGDGTSGDDTSADGTSADGTATTAADPSGSVAADAVVAGEPFPAERCAANRAAGTITFLTGFDFAAAASIVEVITADALGYYEAVCLDVEILPSFSTANYPLVAAGEAQFASGGSFSEVVAFSAANDVDMVAISVASHTPIDTLMIKPELVADPPAEPADLAGAIIGVKGKLPPSIEVMLLEAGLVDSVDYETVPVEGFDPVAHFELDIDALPGWKSNEPGRLSRSGVEHLLLDPTARDIPGSFGVIFTTAEFVEAYPGVTEDFVRATLYGLQAAIADPAAAAERAVALVEANGNPNFLSPEGEVFRWATEAELIAGRTRPGSAAGVPDPDAATAEITAYQALGLYGDGESPDARRHLRPDLYLAVVDDDGAVIWPG